MDMKPPIQHTVTNIAIVKAAMIEYIDGQYKLMTYDRNKYHMSASYNHYLKAIACLRELDSILGTELPELDYLRHMDLEKYGFGETFTGIKTA